MNARPPSWRRDLPTDVLVEARRRIARVFDDFPRVYVAFSGGKDSTVMLHLAGEEARRRGRRFGLLLVDLEAQYRLTVEHAERMFADYADVVDPYWIALPLRLRNAVSAIEPRWTCWDPAAEDAWVRRPPTFAVTNPAALPWFRPGMEFEEFVDEFGTWYGAGEPCACLVGIRTAESLNRWRTIVRDRATRHAGLPWTSTKPSGTSAYPIYDWRTEDLWTFHARTGLPYNALYDRMHQAGLTIHQMRICQPYGDDQRKGLWLYAVIEPETWGRVVARVAGANSGALYSCEAGNIQGRLKVTKPASLTWREFSRLLLDSMPGERAEHYRAKIAVWLKWWRDKGGVDVEDIPDVADGDAEANAKAPSWRRVCRALLRNDYWCKGLSFTQTRSDAYDAYRARMKGNVERWGLHV